MLINRVASQLLLAPEFTEPMRRLRDGDDVPLAVAQSARPLVIASI